MGNIFEDVIMDIVEKSKNQALENGSDADYTGPDGLLYCGKCNTAKQTQVNILGKNKVVPCMCKCAQEAYLKDIEQRKLDEENKKIMQMKRECFPSREFEKMTVDLDDCKDERISRVIKNYIDKWPEMKVENIGLLLYGGVGCGKTFAAACIANALIDQGVPVLMTSFSRIINTVQGMYNGKQEYIDKIVSYPLLIIDDLGAERSSEFMLEQVYNVIDARYQTGLPLIITTNIPIQEIKAPEDMKYKRIYDRVLEMAHPVEFKGESRRRDNLRSNFAHRQELLGL